MGDVFCLLSLQPLLLHSELPFENSEVFHIEGNCKSLILMLKSMLFRFFHFLNKLNYIVADAI